MSIVGQVGVALGTEEQATKTLNVGVAVGGAGGDGGYGNTVHVTNHGAIDVTGDTATGVFAQSIGGGGGDGGGALNAIGMVTDAVNKDSRSVVATVSVGGAGGDGNNGGAVTVDNTGSITTRGVSGYGVFAQSVGGGGGIGGRANTFALVVTPACTLPGVCDAPAATKNNFQLGVTVGGDGGGASNGGAVTVNNSGAIETFGNGSDGIYAQSVGGGGGNAGNGILGSGEILPVPVELAFIPVGSVSFYKNLQVVVGGNSGSSGDGGTVDVTNDKNITTHDANSNGIFAQSIGGGGGIGGNAVIGATGTVGVGGKGGAAGNGGAVTILQTAGKIETFGTASNGIFAQSVGGGGGVAGNVNRALAADIETPVPGLTVPGVNLGIGLGFGLDAGGGGSGGAVTVDVTGEILTHGDSAAGIFAQSVGGGGGLQGELGNDLPVLSLLSWQLGSNGDAGDAGQVDVDLDGSIRTAGNNATGIFAQSAGGDGTGGAVNVRIDGSVETASLLSAGDGTAEAPLRGLGSIAVMAQSVGNAAGNANNGNVVVEIDNKDAKIVGGRSQVVDADRAYIGVGIWILDGLENSITNQGLVTTVGGVDSGFAILATGSRAADEANDGNTVFAQLGGNETVVNFGTVTGSIDLGAGLNSFTNRVGGTFNSGLFANVGSGNFVTNESWMSPGGVGRVMTTSVGGNWTQTFDGTYGVDLDLSLTGAGGEADLIDASEAVSVAGLVDLSLLNVGNALPGEHQVMIARSATALTDSGVALQSPASAVASYELSTTAAELFLSYAIDFSPEGLNGNQSAIGEYISRVQLAGGSESLEPVIAALFNLPNVDAYAAALDQLSPEPYLGNEIAGMLASLQFENALMSCRIQAGAPGVSRFDAEGQCAWLQASGQRTERDSDGRNFGYEQTSVGLRGGVQVAISDRIHAGFAASWDDLNSRSGHRVDGDGHRVQAGAVLKANLGHTTLAAALTGGTSREEVTRFIDLPNGPAYLVTGDEDLTFVSGHARVSHTFEQANWYVRPMVDLGLAHFMLDGFTEKGGSPVALEVDSKNETYVSLQPGFEIGGEIQFQDAVVRPYVRLGILAILDGTDPEISARFVGAPDDVSSFTVVGDVDSVFADIGAGLDVISSEGAALRLFGHANIGETTRNYLGSIKVAVPF